MEEERGGMRLCVSGPLVGLGCAERDRQARAGRWENGPEPVSEVVWTRGMVGG
jgi:hypothetical protein